MACHYLWTLRRRFAAQHLLVLHESVGVFSFIILKSRVNFIIINWASLNA
jgi:hypothetical protein